LEDQLGGTFGQREVAELVDDQQFDAGVAGDDTCELAAAVGLLELVGQAGQRGEANGRPAWQAAAARAIARCVLPVPESPTKMTCSRSEIQPPSASAAIVACGTSGLSSKRNSSKRLSTGKRASSSRRRSRRSARSYCSASSRAAR